MKLGLINSAWLGTAVSTAEGIQLTKDIGFDTIDIAAEALESTPQERRLIREKCAALELPIISCTCCALGIADFATPVRRFHVDRVKRHLDLAYDLGARNVLLVVGEYIWQQEVIPPKAQWDWAVEGLRELGHYAAGMDLEIALELEPFKLSIINSVEKMKQFLVDVNVPAVRANLDVSHLALVNDAPSEIAKLKGDIAHVHFSDCDGKVHGDLPPGRGVVHFEPYLTAIRDAGYDGVVSIELEFAPNPADIVPWVTEAYTATDRIMSGLGIRVR